MAGLKDTLRANLLTLLREAAGGDLPRGQNGTTQLAAMAKKKGSWSQRLLDSETDTRLSALAEAAQVFGLQPWQLLVPGLDPQRRPTISGDLSAWPFPMVSQAEYSTLTAEDRAWVQAKTDTAIKERLSMLQARQPSPPAAKSAQGVELSPVSWAKQSDRISGTDAARPAQPELGPAPASGPASHVAIARRRRP